jgi:hypothetical protein
MRYFGSRKAFWDITNHCSSILICNILTVSHGVYLLILTRYPIVVEITTSNSVEGKGMVVLGIVDIRFQCLKARRVLIPKHPTINATYCVPPRPEKMYLNESCNKDVFGTEIPKMNLSWLTIIKMLAALVYPNHFVNLVVITAYRLVQALKGS